MGAAQQKGTSFETLVTRYLRDELGNPDIDRRAKRGKHDTGDISGIKTAAGARVVIECKNHATMKLGTWIGEAAAEAANDNAPIGVVVHKRSRVGAAENQYVTMTLKTFVELLKK